MSVVSLCRSVLCVLFALSVSGCKNGLEPVGDPPVYKVKRLEVCTSDDCVCVGIADLDRLEMKLASCCILAGFSEGDCK